MNYFIWQLSFVTSCEHVYTINAGHSTVIHKRGMIMTVGKQRDVRRNNFLVFKDYFINEMKCG